MWLWGLAAALPLLIHLLNRRQYREETWAAMEYLLRAMKKNSRRIQIEQLLLLIIRAMILILAAAAWMDLMWSTSAFGPAAVGGGNTHTVLVMDGSYSMATKDGDQSRFERAQQLAGDVIDAASRGDAFTLVLMGEPPRTVIGQPAFDAHDVKGEIANLHPPHAGANLSASLALVEEVLAGVREKHKRLTNQRVCIFTDLGATTWGDMSRGDGEARIQRVSEHAPLTLFDVGRDGSENVAVTSFAQKDPYIVAGRKVTFVAQVKNFGAGDRANYPVRLFVDDRPAGEQLVDVAAGDEASVVFTHEFRSPGEHVLRVQLPDDALEIDNARLLSVPVRPALNVLCIRGKPGAADLIRSSLTSGRSGEPMFHVEVAAENALLERDLSQYDCVFLANVARVGRDEAGVLHQYVSGGGGLIIELGDQVIPESYNRLLADADFPHILPAELADFSPVGDYRFDPRGYEHPLMDAFRGHGNTGLLTREIWKYVKLHVPEKSDARVALWFDSGDPAIVEDQIGRGRVILFATTPSDTSKDRTTNPPTNWSSLLLWPNMPGLIQEMFALAVSGRFENRNVTVGQPFGSTINSAAVGIPLEVKPPSSPAERVRLELDGDRSVWSFTGTDHRGVYRAEFGEPISRVDLFTANIDTRESDLTRIDAGELPPELQHDLEQANESASATALAGPRRPLYHWLLGGVIALLLTETFLAWRMGSPN